MKTIKFILLGLLLNSFTIQSQVSVNVNLGKPPVWAPANPAKVQYYYLPEVDAYYDVPTERFIYTRNGKWFRSAALPAKYRGYNLKEANVVYLTDYRGNSPYKFHKAHKVKYGNRGNAYLTKEGKHNDKSGKGHGKGKKNGKGKKD